MKVALVTLCGCSREIDVPEPLPETLWVNFAPGPQWNWPPVTGERPSGTACRAFMLSARGVPPCASIYVEVANDLT